MCAQDPRSEGLSSAEAAVVPHQAPVSLALPLATSSATHLNVCGTTGKAWLCVCYNSNRERGVGVDPFSSQHKFPARPKCVRHHQSAGTLRKVHSFYLARVVHKGAYTHAANS